MSTTRLVRSLASVLLLAVLFGTAAPASTWPVFRTNTKISQDNMYWSDPEPSLATDREGAVYSVWQVPAARSTSDDWGDTHSDAERITPVYSGDVSSAALPGGTIYYGYMLRQGAEWDCCVSRSSDYGVAIEYTSTAVSASEAPDRPWICAEGNRVWMVYFSDGAIWVRRSDDRGETWGERVKVDSGYTPGGIVLGRSYFDELHVAYLGYIGHYTIRVATSRDGGQTWPIRRYLGDFGDYERTRGMYENVGADRKRNLYVVWPIGRDVEINGQNYSAWHLVVSRSTDGGESWETPVQVIPPEQEAQYIAQPFAPGSYYRAMNPWMDVDPYGRVNISFYDNRHGMADPTHDWWGLNYALQVTITPSSRPSLVPPATPALAFYPTSEVTDQIFRFDSARGDNLPPQEFNGIAADHRFIHCNWGDGRENLTQGEVYYSKAVIGGESPAGWIQTGYNLLSFPAVPLFPDPFDMNGFLAVWEVLQRLNPYTKEMETYPGDFRRVDVGRGYVLTASQPGQISYPGFESPVDAFEIALPVQGQTYIGCPFDAVIPFDNLSIRDENTGGLRSATEDLNSADPWLNWAFHYYDTAPGEFRQAGPSELGLDDDAMRPWYGYIAYCNYDNLTLLIPRP